MSTVIQFVFCEGHPDGVAPARGVETLLSFAMFPNIYCFNRFSKASGCQPPSRTQATKECGGEEKVEYFLRPKTSLIEFRGLGAPRHRSNHSETYGAEAKIDPRDAFPA